MSYLAFNELKMISMQGFLLFASDLQLVTHDLYPAHQTINCGPQVLSKINIK